MASVTADRLAVLRDVKNAVEDEFPITTSATVYTGALVNFVTTTGRVTDASAATGRAFAGVVKEILNDSGAIISAGTGNTGGTVKARVYWNCEMLLNLKTSTRTFTNLGKTVYVADNQTAQGTGVGTALVRVAIGPLMNFISLSDKTQGYVYLSRNTGPAAAT